MSSNCDQSLSHLSSGLFVSLLNDRAVLDEIPGVLNVASLVVFTDQLQVGIEHAI